MHFVLFLIAAVVITVFTGCGKSPDKALVKDSYINAEIGSDTVINMLERLMRGGNAGEYWIYGTEQVKLFNVTDYQIMSVIPLKDATKGYIDKVLLTYTEKINNEQAEITALSKLRSDKEASARSDLIQLSTISPFSISMKPYKHGSFEGRHYNYDQNIEIFNANRSAIIDIIQILKNICNALEKGGIRVDDRIKYLNKQYDYLTNFPIDSYFKLMTEGNRKVGYLWTATPSDNLEQVIQNLNDIALKINSDILRANEIIKEEHEKKKADVGELSENIARRQKLINEYESDYRRLVNMAETDGKAFRVKIHSTKKTGDPIVYLWTICLLDDGYSLKISHIYSEIDFADKTPAEIEAALNMIYSQR